ncbi:MAG: hypothetical protein ACJA0Q_001643 [Saprospiraceae bacterium]|jgi:hypothetical protein
MKKIFLILSGLTLFLFHFSCKKENDSIGLNTGDSTLSSSSIDTFQLNTFSKMSQNTPSNSGTSVFIGGYNTDELGTILATSYTSIAPTDLNYRIPEGGITVTSVSLSLRITGAYGTSFSQSFKVSKTSASVDKEVNYLTSDSLVSVSGNIGTFTIENNDTGTVSVIIDKAFGEEIIAVGDVIFTTSEIFTDVFQGFSIAPTSTYLANTGSVYAVNADEIILTINYAENTSGSNGAVTFSPSSNSRSFYHAAFDVNGAEVSAQISNNSLGNTNFYVQGLGSIKAGIEISSLLTWFNSGNFLINKAIVTIPANTNSGYSNPTSLTIHKASDSSSEGVQAVFDADNNQYVFDIETLLSEKLLAGEEANFEFSVLNSFAHPEQVKLNGANNSTSPASVVIHYTEY